MKNKPITLHLTSLCLFIMGFYTTMQILIKVNYFDNIDEFFGCFYIYSTVTPAFYIISLASDSFSLLIAYSLLIINIIPYFFFALLIQLKKSLAIHIIITVMICIEMLSNLECFSYTEDQYIILIISLIFKVFLIVCCAKNIQWSNKK